nr:hypothetical protein P5626_17070 [Bacillus subtilis]
MARQDDGIGGIEKELDKLARKNTIGQPKQPSRQAHRFLLRRWNVIRPEAEKATTIPTKYT